ncbi:MAG: LAGLIDADG family homing endonuclease [Dehalococcoidia bacterium]
MTAKTDPEDQLIEDIASFRHDPLGFVLFAFPWNEKNTELEDKTGPRVWQHEILEEIGERLRSGDLLAMEAIQEAVASGHGVGKGHPIDMPYGDGVWGDLKPGDMMFAADGSATPIVQVHRYHAEHFRVTFDDGSSVIVSDRHEWAVRGRQHRRKGIDGWETVETRELLRRGVKRANGAAMSRQWEIPIQGAVEYPDTPLPVDPYTYGVWLGDGAKASGRITNADSEVWENIPYAAPDTADPITRTPRGLKNDLVSAGLFGCITYTATVDRRYMESAHRLAVLQGLLDTDGWVEHSGGAAFCSASRQLVRDVIELARSLGLKARQEKFKDNDCAGAWTTHITWDGSTELFRIKRKQGRLVKAEHRYQCRWIDAIEPVGDADGMCIEVEGGLYLTPDFHVTHNSALVAWLIIWAMATYPNTKGVVTANTELQLKTKTWAELAKWHRLSIVNHWFELTATALFATHPEYEKTWRIDMVPWSERNTEAFAGLHNEGRRILLIFDEASAIPDLIWEVSEGALTDEDTEIIWCAFGNPTRNEGRFRECFGAFKHRWSTRRLDSRTVEGTNKAQLQKWVDDYGEDSDFVRVRVRGVFPRAGTSQFIPADIVHDAAGRKVEYDKSAPVVVGVDVARFGDDESVIRTRVGRDAKQFETKRFRGLDTMQLAARVAEHCDMLRDAIGRKPDALFVDGGGVGGGVVDRLRQMGYDVIEVQFGARAADSRMYANKRAEIWGRMREWLKIGAIPDDDELRQQLTAVGYSFTASNQLRLEKKEDMKKRGLDSPDHAEALAVTFAEPVAIRDVHYDSPHSEQGARQTARRAYDPYRKVNERR